MAEYNSRQARNYDFVEFPKEPNCNFITDINKRYEEDDYSGKITLKITTVDNLYLGGGYTSFDKDNGFINETLEESGKAVIPGSSVKGAVRQVCRAISDGCIPYDDLPKGDKRKYNIPFKEKCSIGRDGFHICMVCDMFGMMGLGSKIKFSDFVCDEKDVFEIVSVPKLPLMNVEDKEADKPYKGYKFYKTFCEPINVGNSNKVRAVKRGSVFNGAIDFEGLKEKSLHF
ncbi:MAG: RAMP superfamily CRISPR-associated protein [Ruminococcus sp.]|nr:RAMP superfamily CRISPR-associated protein [Ruminococcus sp.]